MAVVHGGPGAAGEMAPVARELAAGRGVIEPLQTATTLRGQVEELKGVLEEAAAPPVTLIGFSWGAWLAVIVAARFPDLVNKVILVGSGPYEQAYAEQIGTIRLGRLSEGERAEYESSLARLQDPAGGDKAAAFARLGALAAKADGYDVVKAWDVPIEIAGQGNRFHGVLQEGIDMRKRGELLALAGQIRCPVVAIHGNHDPHPAEGVRAPLAAVVARFRFVLLEECGHKPWIERRARARFFQVLGEELGSGLDL